MSEAPSIIKQAGLRYVLIRIVGQITWDVMQCCLKALKALKTFMASIKITASVLSFSDMHRILWIAASAPDYNPMAVWRGPPAS